MNNFNPVDERFYPFLLPFLVGGAVGFPLGYDVNNNKNNTQCCQGSYPYPPYGYYQQTQYYMPYQQTMPYPYIDYTNINFPR